MVSRHFTLPELKAYIAFFGSPLGRKLTSASPQIEMEVMQSKRMMALPPMPRPAGMLPPGPGSAPKAPPHK